VESYDHDKWFPVFGFGGKPEFMNENQVSHCFPLTGLRDAPYVQGIEGVMEAYNGTLM
jgi:hypothetical protein